MHTTHPEQSHNASQQPASPRPQRCRATPIGLVVLALLAGAGWELQPTSTILIEPGLTESLATRITPAVPHATTLLGNLHMVAVQAIWATRWQVTLSYLQPTIQRIPATQLTGGWSFAQTQQITAAQMQWAQTQAVIAGEQAAGMPAQWIPTHGLAIDGTWNQALPPLPFNTRLLRIGSHAIHSLQQLDTLLHRLPSHHLTRLPVTWQAPHQAPRTTVMGLQPTSTHTAFPEGWILGPSGQAITPVPLRFHLGPIGGPSAGLMMALATMAVLTHHPLDPTARIVGTGAIGPHGQIEAIGDVAQKVATAVAARATLFLCPLANVAAARHMQHQLHATQLHILPVTSVRNAWHQLSALASHRLPALTFPQASSQRNPSRVLDTSTTRSYTLKDKGLLIPQWGGFAPAWSATKP